MKKGELALKLRADGKTNAEIAAFLNMKQSSVRRLISETKKPEDPASIAVDRDERWVIVGDTQVPFHHPAVVAVAADLVRVIKPDHLIYNGDMIDNWRISRHAKRGTELCRRDNAQDDLDRTIEVTDAIAAGAPLATKHWIDGNHEDMHDRYIGSAAPEYAALRALRIEELLALSKRGFKSYHPYKSGIWVSDNLWVTHGECALTSPGASVQREIMSIGESVVMNHVHRRSHVRFRFGKKDVMGIENGCLCQVAPSYKAHTNWAHAITVITKHDERTFTPEVVDIVTDARRNVVFADYRGERIERPLGFIDGLSIPWRAGTDLEF